MATLKIYQILPNGVFGGESEIEVNDPNTAPIPAGYTHASPYPIPSGFYAYMSAGWKYAEGNPPPYPSPEQIASQNKSTATSLLQETDWTSIPAVADPLRSNPYLTNQGEFDAYRSQLREIAINPPTTPAVFPTQPQEIWSN